MLLGIANRWRPGLVDYYSLGAGLSPAHLHLSGHQVLQVGPQYQACLGQLELVKITFRF